MSWITPVIDWSESDRMTTTDINRIAGNLNYLYPAAALKENYTQNDFITYEEWASIISSLSDLVTVSGLSADVPGFDMDAATFNAVEDLTADLSERIELNTAQAVATAYAGDDLYSAAAGSYTDTTDNYTRGA